MTLRVGHVEGAANSGTKYRPASVTDPKAPWTCSQGHENKGYWTRCLMLGCNERRPA